VVVAGPTTRHRWLCLLGWSAQAKDGGGAQAADAVAKDGGKEAQKQKEKDREGKQGRKGRDGDEGWEDNAQRQKHHSCWLAGTRGPSCVASVLGSRAGGCGGCCMSTICLCSPACSTESFISGFTSRAPFSQGLLSSQPARLAMELPDDVLSLPSPCGSDDLLEPDPDDVVADVAVPAALPPAPADFLEVFSQPRISVHAARAGFHTIPSVDRIILTGWNLAKVEDQMRCLRLIQATRPRYLMLSPPCTVFSVMQHRLHGRRRDQAGFERRKQEGIVLWKFALRRFTLQNEASRRVALEHPVGASSWRMDCTAPVREFALNGTFDQCLLGLRTAVHKNPVRKRTKMLTNSPALQRAFSRLCTRETCNHFPRAHTVLEGKEGGKGRCKAAEVYPDGFCRAFVEAMQAE
jgi:hypothetical protein